MIELTEQGPAQLCTRPNSENKEKMKEEMDSAQFIKPKI
jgi:hypothetical protein